MRTMTVRGKNRFDSIYSEDRCHCSQSLRILIVLILLAAPCAQAQFDTASVLGTIKDPSGAGIASASVTLLSPAKGVSVTRQTDANGNYEFTNVQPGEYSISVTAANFEKEDTGQIHRHRGRQAAGRAHAARSAPTPRRPGIRSGEPAGDRHQRSRRNGRHPGGRQPAPERPRLR